MVAFRQRAKTDGMLIEKFRVSQARADTLSAYAKFSFAKEQTYYKGATFKTFQFGQGQGG